ncbi:MAG: ribonuclease T2 family protein [Shimia sp.]
MLRCLLVLLWPFAAFADGERAGDFDYYVLAMSWTPNFCALEGDSKDAPQCDAAGVGWSLHGLWPQNERGWPAFCAGPQRNPSRRETSERADLFGSGGYAWHQWNKHGRCSGLEAQAYYDLSAEAFESVTKPDVFRRLPNAVTLPASVVEQAFLEENPTLAPDMLTVTCRAGHIQEVRVCLSKALVPRFCGPDVVRDCTATDALLEPLR